ncbi:DUF493 domain-containing protein [Mariprofundus erugo]|uniref:DUF493 domain-containing protein n=1 Tax=Mariprofundus erugo TaxID=2528639 RepID=A0A5R9GW73_9PROT|nr:DUF493 domain-containing protein [Mariprofundus erugo]TLS69125.1 DUF493 domain-containing protein [Mariprofundus erugo]TLS73986.1 DUF493 domain-containing protein [Mariprofundus erugo]
MTATTTSRIIGAMNHDHNDSPLTFPCRFPIKVMGINSELFSQQMAAIARSHITDIQESDIHTTSSRTAKYLSVSITVTADSREQLDNLYRAFNGHPDVRMVL